MSTGYLVRYEEYEQGKGDSGGLRRTDTIVLRDVHPLVWASNPPAIYRRHFFAVVTGWQEFDCPDHLWQAIVDGNVLSFEDSSLDDELPDDPQLKAQEVRRSMILRRYRAAQKARG